MTVRLHYVQEEKKTNMELYSHLKKIAQIYLTNLANCEALR